MSTDFRALCTELLQPLAEYDDANPYHEHRALIARARAALDQTPAAGPTDEQIADLADVFNGDPVPAIRRALELWGSPAAVPLKNGQPSIAAELEGGANPTTPPTIAPIPVSERLPGDQLCWWFSADEDGGYGSNWTLLRIRYSANGYTHWLPHWALPLPQGGQSNG